MKLTENFSLGEFTCGTKTPENSVIVNLKMLAIQLQKLRDSINKPINVVKGLCAYPTGHRAAVRSNFAKPYIIGQKMIELMNTGEMVKGNVIVFDDFVEIDILGKQSFTDNRIVKDPAASGNETPGIINTDETATRNVRFIGVALLAVVVSVVINDLN